MVRNSQNTVIPNTQAQNKLERLVKVPKGIAEAMP
jgi:hypothetical protein